MLRVDAAPPSSGDRVAIIGMGCWLPAGIDSPQALWCLLQAGGDAVGDVPTDRWNAEAIYDPEPGTPGKSATRRGAFVHDIAAFDAAFFGISPREAALMDPQQRMLLQTAWRALEDAGVPLERVAGTTTGVYIGISHSDYHGIQKFGRHQIDVHTATGGALSIAAARLSHRFDLRGPCLAVDTACSSSLVALDAACAALLSGECEMALVGGVNAMLTPDVTITFSRASMLSPDGRCRAFDATANGYVRGEGAGIVLLKPLSRAQADGDRVRAVIRGTAVNQDGRTSTITVPSMQAQIAMLREACRKADVEPEQVGYVEAHGTGTPVGDPIEAQAIGTVFGAGRPRGAPCLVGSVKTNIGHLEPAAGVAGLIKTVLCVEQGEIPANLHFETPNPAIDFTKLGIAVPQRAVPWDADGAPRIAAVNSFGFGGTNACAVIEQAPVVTPASPPLSSPDVAAPTDRPILLPVSAATPAALSATCRQMAEILECNAVRLEDIAGTLAFRRSHLEHRLTVSARGPVHARELLQDAAAGKVVAPCALGRRRDDPRVAFVFTGQGAQWWGMGRRLLAVSPAFRAAVEACDAEFARLSGWSLLTQFAAPEHQSRMDETAFAQPAMFALQVGLAAELAACGVKPRAVIGHSIGEIAAAHVAGALSLSEAVRVVYHRSRLQERSRRMGAMAALGLAPLAAQERMSAFNGALEVAAVNGPELVTIAGPRAVVESFVQDVRTEDSDVLCQLLRIDYAFHSAQMDAFVDELRASLDGLAPGEPRIIMFSTVTGRAVIGPELDATYWCQNMRQPVLFKHAVDAAIDDAYDVFVEIGPRPVLAPSVAACIGERGTAGITVSTLRREEADEDAIAGAVGNLHANGVPVNFNHFIPSGWTFAELPGYPFEPQTFWAESEESRAARLMPRVHPLLGTRMNTACPLWHAEISARTPRFIADHRIGKSVIFPAAGYVEMMLAAGRESSATACELESVSFDEALVLHEDETVLVETFIAQDRGAVTIRSRARDSREWVVRASGRMRVWDAPPRPIPPWRPKLAPPVQVGSPRLYRTLANEGHNFGPAFQTVRALWREDGQALGLVDLAEPERSNGYCFHPALLDGCFQVIRGFRTFDTADEDASTAIPVDIEALRLFRLPRGPVFSRASLRRESPSEIVADITVIDEAGHTVATIQGFRCRRILKAAERQHDAPGYYREHWVELPALAAGGPVPTGDVLSGTWIVLADRSGTGEALAAELRRQGSRALVVFRGEAPRALGQDHFDSGASRESLGRVLQEAGRLAGVVHLWSLDDVCAEVSAEAIASARRYGIEALLALVGLLEAGAAVPLCIVTSGARTIEQDARVAAASVLNAPLIGFLRSLANERHELRPVSIDLDPQDRSAADLFAEIAASFATSSRETELALRNGRRYGVRLAPAALDVLPPGQRTWTDAERDPPFRLSMTAPGVLASLALQEAQTAAPASGEALVEVQAWGLNFRDVLAATGLLPAGAESEPAWQRLGFECAGVVRAVGAGVPGDLIGRRVVAVAPGAFASHLLVRAESVFRVPDALSFAEAAAVPTIYATAHHALVTLGRLSHGERVLIHAAAGGVGLAAVSIAQASGAEIFATAGSAEKRTYLRDLGITHVFDSRTMAFADEIMQATSGHGVDVILNSLPGDFLEKSLSVLAAGGRFLEIGKRDIYADTAIGLHAFRRNAALFAIDLARLGEDRPQALRQEIESVLRLLGEGRLQSVPVTTFPVRDAVAAFEHMAKARHVGKIVLTLDGTASVRLNARTVPSIDPAACYLVTGGTSGLGLETAQWLVERGARCVVLVSRSGATLSESELAIAGMCAAGADIKVVQADIGRADGAAKAMEAVAASARPLRGIVHAAGVIDDALLAQLDFDQMRRVFDGKVFGAHHLDVSSRQAPLDFFILFSSIAVTVGSIGQAHYAAANSALDAIAQRRRSLGLPALSIQWGPIENRGYLTRRRDVARQMESGGLRPMAVAQVRGALDALLARDVPVVAFADVNWTRLGRSLGALRAAGRTADIIGIGAGASAQGHTGALLLQAPIQERERLLVDYLVRELAAVLKLDVGSIDVDRPLNELGLDSLTSFEFKNRIESDLGVSLPIGKFLQQPTIGGIALAVLDRIDSTDSNTQQPDQQREHGVPVMSFGQEALWLTDKLDLVGSAYGLAMCVSVHPKLDAALVAQSFRRVIGRHECLRMVFPHDAAGLLPQLLPAEAFTLAVHDVSDENDDTLRARLDAEANRGFALDRDPLVRLHLFRRTDRDLLLLHLHHIVADATSIAIVLEEMFEAYFAEREGLHGAVLPRTHRYADFAAWQRRLAGNAEGQGHRAFWLNQLAGAPASFPVPRRPAPWQGRRGAAFTFGFDGIRAAELKEFARREGSTLFTVMLAAFYVLLHEHSGETDLVVGTPVNGRTRPELERLVGYLVNALPVRTQLSEADTFRTLLARVDATLRAALQHQDYPFPLIVRDLDIPRAPGRPPVFNVMFAMERSAEVDEKGFAVTLLNVEGPSLQLREFDVRSVGLARDRAQFDLTFVVEEFSDGIYGVVDYRSDVWDKDTIALLTRRYHAIIRSMVEVPDAPLARRDGVVVETTPPLPIEHEADVVASIRAAVERTPHAVAVADDCGELTYAALFERAETLARGLLGSGVVPGSPVALCLPRNRDLPVAVVAVLLAGCAFVPLDPQFPARRIADIVADADPAIVLVDDGAGGVLPDQARRLTIGQALERGLSSPAIHLPVSCPQDLAYVIFTSGSTGKPAGVEIERAALASFMTAMRDALPLVSEDAWLAVTTLSFDIALVELLLPLTIGARVVVADERTARDGIRLAACLDGTITVMQATPATWQMLVEAGWQGGAHFKALCGGESLPASLAHAIRTRVGALWNLYGPTETTVWSTVAEILGDTVTIGKPLANSYCRIVDPDLRPVAPGRSGELLIGGRAVARSYRNDPERTRARFVADPCDASRRMFRTGDIVRLGVDGQLEFHGRRDDQVKVRGFRIELGEIESVLRAHGAVRDAAVIPIGDEPAARRLAAFVVGDVGERELSTDLHDLLPAYMVPSLILRVDVLPRLPNGKLDRRRLAALATAPDTNRALDRLPDDATERGLLVLVRDILGTDRVGVDDDFFAAGGTSLLGIRYVVRAGEMFGVELDAGDLVRSSTVTRMARRIRDRQAGDGAAGAAPAAPSNTSALWRPLAVARAEGAIPAIDAAAIAYLPDTLAPLTSGRLDRGPAEDTPHWTMFCRTPLGTVALVTVPRFGRELLADPAAATPSIAAAVEFGSRLGAEVVSLTGIIPSITDLGRALPQPDGLKLTTGHPTTACAMVLSIEAALAGAGRDLAHESVAFVGTGAIGTATLRLMLDRLPAPRRLILCDVPAKAVELEVLARELRGPFGFLGEIRTVMAFGPAPDEIYDASLVIGATNMPHVVDVQRLRPGAIVVDDSFPYCFDLDGALARMSSRGDVLFHSGGKLAIEGLEWQVHLPHGVPAVGAVRQALDSTAAESEMTGCILSGLLSHRFGAPVSIGPTDLGDCREHWRQLRDSRIAAAPLHCGHWRWTDERIEAFRMRWGTAG